MDNRDPRYVGWEDVKRTLARWSHPSTQSVNRSKLVAFYDWFMQEGYRGGQPGESDASAEAAASIRLSNERG